MTEKITYKEPNFVWIWLKTALEKEWRKYKANPVSRDYAKDHETAQAWGYVVAGYFLIEQGLKSVLHLRGENPERTHALSVLFTGLPEDDQDVLREYYGDFLHTFPGMSAFPLKTLDDFLANLDGEKVGKDKYVGSFDWRYFLTEEGTGTSMPIVSINVMHEIVYGCVHLILFMGDKNKKPLKHTYSWRLQWKRKRRYEDWLMVRMNSRGWGKDGDRIEILWGPDYKDRHDYLVFKEGEIHSFFSKLPDTDQVDFVVCDKREEIELFDRNEGWRSIGMIAGPSERRQESESGHVMF